MGGKLLRSSPVYAAQSLTLSDSDTSRRSSDISHKIHRLANGVHVKEVKVVGIDIGTCFSKTAFGIAKDVYDQNHILTRSTLDSYNDVNDTTYSVGNGQSTEIATQFAYVNGTIRFGPDELEGVPETMIMSQFKLLFYEESPLHKACLDRFKHLVSQWPERLDPVTRRKNKVTSQGALTDIYAWLWLRTHSSMVRKMRCATVAVGGRNFSRLEGPIRFAASIPSVWSPRAYGRVYEALCDGCGRDVLYDPTTGRSFFASAEVGHTVQKVFTLVREPIAASETLKALQESQTTVEAMRGVLDASHSFKSFVFGSSLDSQLSRLDNLLWL